MTMFLLWLFFIMFVVTNAFSVWLIIEMIRWAFQGSCTWYRLNVVIKKKFCSTQCCSAILKISSACSFSVCAGIWTHLFFLLMGKKKITLWRWLYDKAYSFGLIKLSMKFTDRLLSIYLLEFTNNSMSLRYLDWHFIESILSISIFDIPILFPQLSISFISKTSSVKFSIRQKAEN